MKRSQRSERVGVRPGSALAALILMWAAPAAGGVEPPPAANDAANDATNDATDDATDAADREKPDQPADAARETSEASNAAPSASGSHQADSQSAEAPAAEPNDSQQEPSQATSAQSESPLADAPVAPAAAGAPGAGAEAQLAPSSPASTTDLSAHAARVYEAPAVPRIGAGLDVGLPDGATASIVVRPFRSIRAHAGLSHNMISLGERVGLTWVPLSWWVSPTLSVEYGHYADGNANPLVRMVTGDRSFSSAVLDRVGYDYANAHAGLEFGRRWFTFYIHAGYSRVTSTVHNLSAETMSESSGTTSVTFSKDPSVRLWSVSARLGFIVYLAK